MFALDSFEFGLRLGSASYSTVVLGLVFLFSKWATLGVVLVFVFILQSGLN